MNHPMTIMTAINIALLCIYSKWPVCLAVEADGSRDVAIKVCVRPTGANTATTVVVPIPTATCTNRIVFVQFEATMALA